MSNLIEGKLADLEQLSDPIEFIPATIKGKFLKLNKLIIMLMQHQLINLDYFLGV